MDRTSRVWALVALTLVVLRASATSDEPATGPLRTEAARPTAGQSTLVRSSLSELVGDGPIVAEVDGAALANADADGGVVILSKFPLTASLAVDLDLRRFQITGPNTRFVLGCKTGDDQTLRFDPSRVILLRGRATGYPDSHVFMAVSDLGSTGFIDLGNGHQRYGVFSATRDSPTPPERLSVFPTTPYGGSALPVPFCGLEATAETAGSALIEHIPSAGSAPIKGMQQIELAVETDYEFFTLFGDLDLAAAYVVKMYGAVADIYMRDVDSRIDLTFVRLWDDPDDLFNEPDPLRPFRDYWNENMGHVQRDLAQFFTGRRDLPWGGVAWLDALCTDFSYSVAAYALGFFADPSRPSVFNRDISVTAHEIGHNCGTLHTHDFGLDTCNDEESEPQRGTIMSYCGQTFTGGEANIDLRFHTTIQPIMEDFITTRDCVVDDCNQNGIDDALDIQEGNSADDNNNQVPDECEDCNNNGELDDQDILNGTSLDLNENGVPDECEPDCNGNDVPDDLDIATGTSEDLYGNGIPDECEADCNNNGQLDYNEIQADMSLDVNRNALLDSCEDCDGDGTPDLIELDHAHNVWIASLEHTTIREYLATVGPLTNLADDAGIAEGQDLVITPDRRILVSSRLDHRVLEFDLSGAYVGNLVAPGAGGLAEPAGMTFTPDGNLIVASRSTDSVLEYDAVTGDFIGPFITPGAGGLIAPFGLAFGDNGNVFVTSNDSQVLEFDGVSGAFVRVFVAAADNGGLLDPRGVLFLPTTGNLLVASYGTNQVLEFDADTGAFVRQFNQGGTEDRMTLDQPSGLRIGPDGDVYVSRTNIDGTDPASADSEPLHLTNARIFHFDVDSGFLMRAYILGFDSGVLHPTGFDFVPGDDLDCNLNLIPDSCDIASGTSRDVNNNGVPDECEGLGDLDGDGNTDLFDFAFLLNCYTGPDGSASLKCRSADLDRDGDVDFRDFGAFQIVFTSRVGRR